jgi:transposase
MVFTRFKKFGKKEYAYEITEIYDKKLKRSRQKTRYLGIVIDKSKQIFEKKKINILAEKTILDFGDVYTLSKFYENSEAIRIIKNLFGEFHQEILALVTYRLCYPSAMMYAEEWFNGNFAKIIYPEANLASQRISDFFKFIGDENMQRKFFKAYLSKFSHSQNGLIIDGTSLPNQIHMPLSAWGRSNEQIDKQIRFLLVVDKESSEPLYFRAIPGNIVDVTTLQTTIKELRKYDVKNNFVYLDAGFFSEENIKEMYSSEIDFITRLPAERIIYKQLINEEAKNIESTKNFTRYGKRALFIKQKEIELFGKKIFAHIILDPQRKGREINRLGLNTMDEKDINNDLEYELMTRGIMILISSFNIPKEEIVPAYYIRQTAEKMFGFSKDDLDILPIRVHSEEALRGFLFLQFVSLILFVQLKKQIGKKHTVEEVLLNMRNLKCKVFDNEVIISEPTRQQKDLAKLLGFILPKSLGI